MPRLRPPALTTRTLPANVVELQAQAVVRPTTRLIDEVDLVYKDLIENPKFRAVRGADDPEKTVHGSVVADDIVSAQLISERGVQMRLPLIIAAGQNYHLIAQKLRGAEGRYQAKRKQRSQAPHPMPDETNEDAQAVEA